ncbi:glutathionylspermidine synthase family protein [Sphingobacterium sp. UT-1RO-CII-1]|uniref:glutathionylspermidine synthase family protein n=1 Tax=Sphingobacterium sp. UT-1RO-CII-1 TaxID=2995225 RepID=UPI00227C1B94|nr:glutathionylspermidine synthase family protein [Sphingobacterium sp. UT-1RO-CII-1]MCY4780433.1 glutathionylspermidine synthase family protein [Sphingobacterium sp. UT-1RO-CII-1]
MHIKKLRIDPQWESRLESIGYGYHSIGGVPYWVDDYYYEINNQEADLIYNTTQELWNMCLQAVEYIIKNKLYHLFKIPSFMIHHIEHSWENDEPSIYGRFDFAYHNSDKTLKLLEFNADTPTSLFESGIVQWYWKKHYFPELTDQFNSIHEQLIHSWREIKPYLKADLLHFTCAKETLEDLTNLEYLRDTALQAGINTKLIYIDDIGWSGRNFVDLEGEPIQAIFKLYPWEWMIHEEFAVHIVNDINKAQWIEPSWKMLLSNKAILPILWELFPNHPNLLSAYFEKPYHLKHFVKKPILSREGANIEMYYDDELIFETAGDYGQDGYIYQELANLHKEETGFSIIGSWIIGQEPCGISFRESDMPITTDKSRFIPHIIRH